jgi:hypothetical protein
VISKQRLVVGLVGGLAALLAAASPLVTLPAEADPQITDLHVSSAMTAPGYEPAGEVGTDFPGHNHGVFVTFAYQDLPPGSTVTRIVRFGGSDYNWDSDQFGHLACCAAGGSGRYGFPVLQLSGDPWRLPGGDYEAFIYLNGAQVGHLAWGVNGAGGRDYEIPGRPNDDRRTHDDRDAT